jgi:hypothetical protein
MRRMIEMLKIQMTRTESLLARGVTVESTRPAKSFLIRKICQGEGDTIESERGESLTRRMKAPIALRNYVKDDENGNELSRNVKHHCSLTRGMTDIVDIKISSIQD